MNLFLINQGQDEYHTVMLAQDWDEVRIGVGTYSKGYLDYLASPGSLVIPDASEFHTRNFLEIEEVGPFYIGVEEELLELYRILYWLLQGILAPSSDVTDEPTDEDSLDQSVSMEPDDPFRTRGQ